MLSLDGKKRKRHAQEANKYNFFDVYNSGD